MASLLLPRLIAHAAAGSTNANNVTTTGVTTTGATFIAIVVGALGTTTITDSNSNSWTGLTQHTNTGNSAVRIFYSAGPTVGAAHTFTATGSGTGPAICVMAFDTVITSSPFDQQNGSATSATGSITPSQDGELIIVGASSDNSSAAQGPITAINATTPIAPCDVVLLVAGQHYTAISAWGIQGTAIAVNTTVSLSGDPATAIASFKCSSPAAGGTGGTWAFA